MTSTEYDLALWQNTVSVHQGPLVRELGDLGFRVLVVTQTGTSAARRSMGWSDADFGDADVVTAPTPSELREIVSGLGDTTAHVFSGLDTYPLVAAARRLVEARSHGHVFVSTESFDARGAAGLARRLRYVLRSRRLQGVDTVLTIGGQAREQFRPHLPPSVRVSEFGYFVQPRPTDTFPAPDPSGPTHVAFVGELIDLKRPLLLLESLLSLPRSSWRLSVVGDGPLRGHLSDVATRDPAADVTLLGTLPNPAVADVLRSADLLVLPSEYDGWGAVVSEALSVGTPVLVSSAAGSSDLVTLPLAGQVFASRSQSDFVARLSAAVAAGPFPAERRAKLSDWAARTASPAAAAAYLAALLRAPADQVLPPWRVPLDDGGAS